MELRFLKLVTAILNYGSLSKAANKLHLTQSALSHQLKEFENQKGIRFFIRANKRLHITPAGQLVYESAQTILSEVERLETRLKNLSTGQSGTLRLSAGCTTSYHWLPGVLGTFSENYPNVQVDIQLDATGNPLPEITKGNLDLAIVNRPLDHKEIEYINLFEDELVAVISKNHPWNGKSYIIARDFKDVHLIIHSKPLDTVIVYDEVLKPKSIEPKKISALPLTEATIELIRANMGIAVMAKWAIKPWLESGLVSAKRINRKGLYRKHYAARLQGMQLPDYFDHFIEFMKQHIPG